jgi:hypothetical protein
VVLVSLPLRKFVCPSHYYYYYYYEFHDIKLNMKYEWLPLTTSVQNLIKIGAAVNKFKRANGWINGHTWPSLHVFSMTITTCVHYNHHYVRSFMTITTYVPHDHHYVSSWPSQHVFPMTNHNIRSSWPSLHMFPMTITTCVPHDYHVFPMTITTNVSPWS